MLAGKCDTGTQDEPSARAGPRQELRDGQLRGESSTGGDAGGCQRQADRVWMVTSAATAPGEPNSDMTSSSNSSRCSSNSSSSSGGGSSSIDVN